MAGADAPTNVPLSFFKELITLDRRGKNRRRKGITKEESDDGLSQGGNSNEQQPSERREITGSDEQRKKTIRIPLKICIMVIIRSILF